MMQWADLDRAAATISSAQVVTDHWSPFQQLCKREDVINTIFMGINKEVPLPGEL